MLGSHSFFPPVVIFQCFCFCSGFPNRVCWPADHLPDVLLPPAFHLFSKIWLYQQQALGRPVSVSLLLILTCTQSRVCTDNPFNKHPRRDPLGCRLRTKGLMNHSKLSIVCKCMCLFCSLACMCHSFHYVKRILETVFVHRISHGTMPLRNIFKVNELLKPDIQSIVTH